MSHGLQLDRCDGPECPRCGCQDVEILAPPQSRSMADAYSQGWFACQRRRRAGGRPSPARPDKRLPPSLAGQQEEFVTDGRARCKHCGEVFSFRPRDLEGEKAEGGGAEGGGREVEAGGEKGEGVEEISIGVPGQSAEPQRPPASVPYYVVECPKCGSHDTKVARTKRPVRWHKCQACGHPFKSVERMQRKRMVNDD